MIGYTKLFESLVTSTIWGERNETRIVWITMLALRNSRNVVEASLPGLAHIARVSLEDTEKAIELLKSSDPYSRSKEFDGRRIEEVDGGWKILNGEKYSRKLSEEDRREYFKQKQAEYRRRKKEVGTDGSKAGARKALEEGFEHYNSDNTKENT